MSYNFFKYMAFKMDPERAHELSIHSFSRFPCAMAELFGQGKANLVLLRPDRFCMAAFDRDGAADTLAQAWQMLGSH